jgi:succinate dehydrogenase / fumarate reductase iron-sulfur subunit
MIASAKPKIIKIRVKRQDGPGQASYWQSFDVPYEENMNIISALQKIAANPTTRDGQRVAPVAWDCGCLEEVCGACSMVINGRVRQSCSALIDRLLDDSPSGEIVLEPMSKFPVLRDLAVDRSRIFAALKKVKAWVSVDGYYDMGPGPKQSRTQQEAAYPLSECMSCGCCLEACPQYVKIELPRVEGESDEAYQARQEAAHNVSFVGAHAISQTILFNNNPTGQFAKDQRLEALMQAGGIQDCGNAQNCVAVCPKHIPLTTSIAQAGRATTLHSIKEFFDF